MQRDDAATVTTTIGKTVAERNSGGREADGRAPGSLKQKQRKQASKQATNQPTNQLRVATASKNLTAFARHCFQAWQVSLFGFTFRQRRGAKKRGHRVTEKHLWGGWDRKNVLCLI